jgi:DNA invertase Pin-like site-specific DNA recombinase
MPTVISYLRYSSAAQTGGDSVRRQLEQSEKWAADRGLVIDESLRDESVSAFRGANADAGALGSILRRIQRNEIAEGSILIVESLDRLARTKPRLAMAQLLSVVNSGITVATLSDGKEYSPEKCDELELIQSLLIMSRAHEESSIKSFRSRANWQKRREAAKGGQLLSKRIPSWLLLDSKNKLVIDKAKAATVRYVFDLALKGLGVGSIVKRLNAEGVKVIAPARDDRSKDGAHWYNRFVYRLFTEAAVIGVKEVKQFEGKRRVVVDRIENYYPPIIDREVYERVNAMLGERRNPNRVYNRVSRQSSTYVNVFNGILKDEKGNSFTTSAVRGYRYLVSLGAISKRNQDWHYLRQDILEEAFLRQLAEYDFGALVSLESDSGRAVAAAAELAATEKQIADLEQQLVDLSAPASAIRILEKLEARRAPLAAEVKAAQASGQLSDREKVVASHMRMLAILDGDATDEQREEMAALVKRLVRRITLQLSVEGSRLVGVAKVDTVRGDGFAFRFSYNNQRFLKSDKKIDTLEITPLANGKAA